MAEKKTGFMAEFKKFIMRGNVLDMAIGLVVGSAFTAIVQSVVKDIINPVIGLIIGKIDFQELRVILIPATEDAGEVAIRYGALIQNIIQFPQYFSSMPWLSAAVMYIPGLIGMIGFCIRIMQASLIPNLKLLRGKAYLTNTIKGPIPQEEHDKHNKKKSKKKEEDQ